MAHSLNLDNLREITNGDPQLETMLLRSFLESAATSMACLQTALANTDERTWHAQSHTLKGICLNMGATLLAELYEKAQHSSIKDARHLIAGIRSEYDDVRHMIEQELARLSSQI